MTNYEMVREFHDKFNVDNGAGITPDNIHLRTELINEELAELEYELYAVQKGEHDKEKIAKELADLLYVCYGMADVFNIPIDDVFKEVHRSNLSKLGKDGKPIYREDGKVLKGPNYSPANLKEIVT